MEHKKKGLKMKKIVLTFAAMLSMTAAIAGNEAANTDNSVKDYDFTTVNFDKLAKSLNLSADQTEDVLWRAQHFADRILWRSELENNSRETMIDRVVEWDLRNMKIYLDKNQYKKYLRLLNATFTNRGLNK